MSSVLKPSYEMIDSGDLDNHWNIKILDGKYKDTTFKFLEVKFKESEDELIVKFNYELIETPESLIIKDLAEFEDILGAVLHDVLIGLSERTDGKNRNDDTQELDS